MKNKKTMAGVAVLAVVLVTFFLALGSLEAKVDWPPRLGEPFPDIELVDQTGQSVKMSSFKGKVILVEYIGMTCPACQAFTGAHDRGSFENIRPQRGLDSIEKLFPQYTGGLTLNDKRIVLVQILLYNMSMGAPTADDAKTWAQHFQLERSNGKVVLAGKKQLLGQASYNLIPGFQLIDKDLIVRSDSTGHHPRHNLYTELLPKVRAAMTAPATTTGASTSSRAPNSQRVLTLADDKTIQAAYRAIPHARTVFDASDARMSTQEKQYLDIFFRLVDLAIVQRVGMTQWITSGGKQGKVAEHYDVIFKAFNELDTPSTLNKVQNLVVAAIKDQRAFLIEWKQSGKRAFRREHRRVQSASAKLRSAYALLIKAFGHEGPQNKQAFFDYLCALDFI